MPQSKCPSIKLEDSSPLSYYSILHPLDALQHLKWFHCYGISICIHDITTRPTTLTGIHSIHHQLVFALFGIISKFFDFCNFRVDFYYLKKNCFKLILHIFATVPTILVKAALMYKTLTFQYRFHIQSIFWVEFKTKWCERKKVGLLFSIS